MFKMNGELSILQMRVFLLVTQVALSGCCEVNQCGVCSIFMCAPSNPSKSSPEMVHHCYQWRCHCLERLGGQRWQWVLFVLPQFKQRFTSPDRLKGDLFLFCCSGKDKSDTNSHAEGCLQNLSLKRNAPRSPKWPVSTLITSQSRCNSPTGFGSLYHPAYNCFSHLTQWMILW